MDSVRAVDRAIDVLEAFVGRAGGLKITELEEITGIARPTLYRLVRTLEGRRLVRQTADPTRYELDVGVLQFAGTWLKGLDIVAKAEPALQALAREVGETVALCVERDGRRIYVREIVSQQPITFSRGVGATDSLTRGASGLAILAWSPDKIVAAALEPLSRIERGRIRAEIAAARERGYAVSVDAIIPGATAVAAPILPDTGGVAGSVGVFGPTVRMPEKALARAGQAAGATARSIAAVLA